MIDRTLSVEEAAERLGCRKRKAEQLIASGELPSLKLGKLRRVRPEAVDAYLRRLEQADQDERARVRQWADARVRRIS